MSEFNEKVITEFRTNGGRVDSAGFGNKLVLLHTIGRRTRAPTDVQTSITQAMSIRARGSGGAGPTDSAGTPPPPTAAPGSGRRKCGARHTLPPDRRSAAISATADRD
jgi:hypothetical protein